MKLKEGVRAGVEIQRVVMINWQGFASEELNLRGNVAFVGANGSGKSSTLDAIQLVLSGGNKHYFAPNASAEVTSGRSSKDERRSILDYCLGYADGRRLREESVTYVVLVFRRRDGGAPVTAGICLSARAEDADATEIGSFLLKGFDLSKADFVEGGQVREYDAFQKAIRKQAGGANAVFLTRKPTEFSRKLLREVTGNSTMEPETFLRAIKNALTFRDDERPTEFVRNYVLAKPRLSSSKVDTLRRSFDNWKAIEAKVVEIAKDSEDVEEMMSRGVGLLKRQREARRNAYLESTARLRIGEGLHDVAMAKVRGAQEQVGRSKTALDHSRIQLSEMDQTIAVARARLGGDAIRAQVAEKRDEQRRATRDADASKAWIDQLMVSMMTASALRPELVREGLLGKESLAAIETFEKAGREGKSLTAILPPLVDVLSSMPAKLDEALGKVMIDRIKEKESLSEDQEALRRFDKRGSNVSEQTDRLLQTLEAAGIEAAPLCSLVEVLDPEWRYAAETMLGRAREAVIVAPQDVSRVMRIMDENDRLYVGCMVYDAKDGDRASPSGRPGTLSGMLRTDNPYARAFLNIRIGNVVCVEDREDLRNEARAVTRSVMAKSGGAVTRMAIPRDQLLGRDVQRSTLDALRRRIEEGGQYVAEYQEREKRLSSLKSAIDRFLMSAQRAEELEGKEREMEEARSRATAARDAADTLDAMLQGDEFAELRNLEEDRRRLAEQVGEDEEDHSKALIGKGRAEDALSRAKERLDALSEGHAEMRASIDRDVVQEADAEFRRLMAELLDPSRVETHVRNLIETSGGRIEQSVQRLRQDVANYARGRTLAFGEENDLEAVVEWLESRLLAIGETMLVEHQEKASQAKAEMAEMIYNDFILNLASDMADGRRKIAELNKALSEKVFNGESFRFTHAESVDFKDVIALSEAVMRRERSVGDLFLERQPGESGMSDAEERGRRKIQAIFDGNGKSIDEFTDYRNYMTFDLVSFKVGTGERVAGSKERLKRSGGERQIPFYIAMGSALASIAFRQNHRGMGIGLFDEAFGALDGANTSAAVEMLKEFGLQLFLSAPTERAGAFIKHVDTVVNVSRDGARFQLDVEYPTDHAREEIERQDPTLRRRPPEGGLRAA